MFNPIPSFRCILPKQTSEKIDIFKDRKSLVKIFSQTLRHICNTWTDIFAVETPVNIATKHLNLSTLDNMSAGYRHAGD